MRLPDQHILVHCPLSLDHPNAGSSPAGITVADVNSDGKPDLLTANYGNGTAGVLLGNGNGTFQSFTSYSTGGSEPARIAVADVNGDGKLDLLTTNQGRGTAGVTLGNGNGTFQTATTFSTGGSTPWDIAVADVNGDGKPDLLTTNQDNGTAGVLLNTTVYAVPTLTFLNPTSGPVGTQVTITGTNLGGATAVRFNGTAATFSIVNATTLTATVPTGATTGPVTTPGGSATSPTGFVVRVAPTTVADAYITPQGVTLTGNVLTNDLGTKPRAILIIRPTHGTLLLNPNGTFTYQPAAGYVGTDSFLYYACNMGVPLVCGDPATVSISVGPAGYQRTQPSHLGQTHHHCHQAQRASTLWGCR